MYLHCIKIINFQQERQGGWYIVKNTKNCTLIIDLLYLTVPVYCIVSRYYLNLKSHPRNKFFVCGRFLGSWNFPPTPPLEEGGGVRSHASLFPLLTQYKGIIGKINEE